MAKGTKANQANRGAQATASGSGMSELIQRLKFLFLAILVYRFGAHVPVPGVDPVRLEQLFAGSSDTVVGLANMFTGGALERFSILALGIMPYITASIIMQLMSAVSPQLEQLKKEGEAGRRKISQYTRYGTLGLGIIQATGMAVGMQGQIAFQAGPFFIFTTVVSLVTGTMFLMWLGEQITERGIGNGISIIIFAGIIAGIPPALGQSFESAKQGDLHVLALITVLVIVVAVVAAVVFMERGQRRITVNYAKRQQGRKMYAAQQSHLPLKINMAGVIPPIFATSILLFPTSIAQYLGNSRDLQWLQDASLLLAPGQPLNLLLFTVLIIFFCYFYTSIQFNPHDVADNLKKSGAYIPGFRPGEQTANYIDTVLARLTLVGSLYLVLICLLPQALQIWLNIPFYLGGTSMLISVVVVMDTMAQIQSHLMSNQYGSLMKKANLKGSRK